MSDPPAAASRAADDLRLAPVAATVWGILLVGTAGLSWWVTVSVVLGATAGLLVVARVLRRWVLVACAIGVLAGAGVAGVRTDALHESPVYAEATQRSVAAVELVTTGDPRLYGGRGPAWARSVHVPAQVRLLLDGDARWAVRVPVDVIASGDQAAVWLRRPAGVRVAATVRFAPADAASGLAAAVRIRGPSEVVADPGVGWRVTNRVRAGLRTAVQHRRPDQRALVPALVVGDTSAMPPALEAAFRTTALTHLSAVSGANLALMLAFVLTVARALGVRGWCLRVLGLAGVLAFVGICRTEPSVLRAAAMGIVALAGLGTAAAPSGRSRGRSGLRSLCAAAIALLLADPWLCRSAGFALSVLATAGIVRWARPWCTALQRWLPAWLAEAVAVPLAAQLATQPVVTAISGQVSIVGVAANALAGPWVGPATVLGFAAAGVSLAFAPAAAVLGFAAAWVAQPIIWIARAGAALPGAAVAVATTPLVIGAIAAGCGLMVWLLPGALRRPWLALLVTLVVILAAVRVPPQPGWPPRGWFLVACDVGQGDGLVLRSGQGSAVVVDVGPDPVAMRRCLDGLGVRTVPLLVLSHFHADHVGGLAGLLHGRQVGLVLTSPLASPPSEAAHTGRVLTDRPGITVRAARVGERIMTGDVTWQTLGPVLPARADDDAGNAESSIENDSSVVAMVTLRLGGGTVRVLLPGDAEPPEQQDLLRSGAELRADVLKVPHHGSSRQAQPFLAATDARIAIASAGRHNVYGHPAPSTVRRLEALGMTVLRTDTEGSVAVWSRAGQLGVVSRGVR